MKIRFTGPARTQSQRNDASWRQHARIADPDEYKNELTRTLTKILTHPRLPKLYALIDGNQYRRVYMAKTDYHVYYTVNEEAAEIWIHAIWHARRGAGPRLG